MDRKSLFVLYTGGTIGMRSGRRGLTPASNFVHELKEMIEASASAGRYRCSVACLEPIIDSADVTPDRWFALAQHLWSARDAYDGFIVLHGTDTLAYTASALSFLLLGFGKPIVLTGAGYHCVFEMRCSRFTQVSVRSPHIVCWRIISASATKFRLTVLHAQRSDSGRCRGVTWSHDWHLSQRKHSRSSLNAATTGSKSFFPKFGPFVVVDRPAAATCSEVLTGYASAQRPALKFGRRAGRN